MKNLFILVVMVFSVQRSFAQKTPTTMAEWQQKLRIAKHDTTKLSCYGGILEIPLHEDTVLVYLKKAEVIGKKYLNHPTNINIFTRYGNMYRTKNMPDSAKYFYNKAFDLALRLQNKRYLKFADFYRTYAIKSLTNKISHLYQVLNKYDYDNNNTFDKSLQYQIYNYLIHNYLTFGNIAKAKRLLNTAKPYIVTLQDSVKYYNAFTRIIALDAENTYKLSKSLSKILFSDKFNAIYADLTSFTERNNLPNLRVEPLNSYGKILFYEKKYNDAINKAQELLDHAQKYKYPHAMNLGNMLFAESYVELGQYQKALSFLEKTTPNNIIQNYKRLYLFSKIYQEIGDSPKAYKYLLEAIKEEEKIKGVNEQLLSAEIESQLELNKKQQEIAAQELENKLKEERIKAEQQQKTIVITLLLLSLGLLAWAVYGYQKQRQLRHLLELQYHSLETKTKELTEANQTKDKIFSVLGHDLQSPINELKAILMLFDIQSITPAKIKDLILPLSHKIETVQAMLSNLLQWSVLELNQQSQNRYTVSFKEIIEKVIKQLNNNAQKKQIQITTQLQPIEAVVNAEEMEIVLRNLLSNAIKFTPNNGSIWIEGMEDQQTISIKIKDTGIGLPKEVKEHTTAYPTSRRGTAGEKGTGIGLKISRELVEKNGGVFTFENNSSTGTVISLVFKKSA